MKDVIKIIPILFFIILSLTSAAQNNTTDTSSVSNVSTALQPNQFVISKDSIEALKNSTSFAYLKNLDSLLRAEQKLQLAQQKDKQPEAPSWIENFFRSRITQYIFWILAAIFVVFILSKLFFAEGFFQKQSSRSKVNESPKQDEELSGTANYDKLIAQAIDGKLLGISRCTHRVRQEAIK